METEGYHSMEEYVKDCTELFLLLEKEEPEYAGDFFSERIRQIEEKEQAADVFLPAGYLRECCALNETEYWLVMLAFCCEVEDGLCLAFRERYHERWPSLQYGLHLLSPALPVDFRTLAELCGEKGTLSGLFSPYQERGAGEESGCLMRPLLLARAPFYFLLTGGLPEEEWYTLCLPEEEEERGFLPLHEKESRLLSRYLDAGSGLRLLLHGSRGSGKHTLLRQVCTKKQVNAVFLKLSRLWREPEREKGQRQRTLRLLGRLLKPVIILELTGGMAESDMTAAEREDRLLLLLSEELAGGKQIFLTENAGEWELAEKFCGIKLSLAENLSAAEGKLALDAWLLPKERREWQEELLGGIHMNIGELAEGLKAVRIQAEAESIPPEDRQLWEKLLPGGRMGAGLGKLVEYRADPDEIVLPQTCRKQLETVLRLARVWTGRPGLHVLFHGSSGTGKTMAASILARQLKLPLFKVDLSKVFDKYIGETEKHIDEIFRTAERNQYLLFFDEADALFAKRTGIQDSHDRYANVSTSYLLQRIEEYDGMLILATNLMNHFDDAFVRRIRFVIKFQNLDKKGRELLWEKALTCGLALAEDISFSELAAAAELSPARIRSAAHVARLLAAGGSITRELVWEALELEAGKDETIVKKF